MPKYCVLKPKDDNLNSVKLFDDIKKNIKNHYSDIKYNSFVYNKTWDLYKIGVYSGFINENKETLSLDAKGFPTFDSLIMTKEAKYILGEELQNSIIEDRFSTKDNNRANYFTSIETALQFNKKNQNKIATVVVDSEGKIKIKISERNASIIKEFTKQYAYMKAAAQAANLLSPLGITIGDIDGNEAKYRNGKVDFNRVEEILNGTSNIIKVSNNVEGAKAIGEELSHLIIGTKRSNPIIQRLITSLSNNEEALKSILGDKYDSTLDVLNNDMSLVAEEALGQLLNKHLIDLNLKDSVEETNKEFFNTTGNLFNRARNFIVNKFKGTPIDAADRIIAEAEAAVDELAENIVTGNMTLTKKDVIRAKANAIMNDLNEQNIRVQNILKQAIIIENKRKIITSNPKHKRNIVNILRLLNKREDPNTDQLLLLANYIDYAAHTLNSLNLQLDKFNDLGFQEKFKLIRKVYSFAESFKPTIDLIYEESGANRLDGDNIFKQDIQFNNNTTNVLKLISKAEHAMKNITGQISNLIIPTYAEYLKPIVGEIKDTEGNILDIEKMIRHQVGDISMLDRWLDPMANSSDQFLQSLSTIQRKATDSSRLKSLDDIRRIQVLQKEADSLGIKDFEWMFEHDEKGNKTGEYIQEINMTKFQKDLEAFNKKLDDKYGEYPAKPSDRKAKLQEKKQWLNTHTNSLGTPLLSLYKNLEYERLSTDYKNFLKKYLKFKEEFDQNYPPDKVLGHAIQIRRDGTQRFLDNLSNPGKVFDSVKEAWKSAVERRVDDEQIFGESSVKGMVGFDGSQFNILPIFYQHKLEDPNELSTDVFRALTAYVISSNEYAAMDNVLDALEVGRIIGNEFREVQKTIGGNPLEEEIHAKEGIEKKPVLIKNSEMAAKMNEWFDSAVYKKFYAEGSEIKLPFINKNVSSTKLTSATLNMASTVQISFNWLSQAANVGTGISMTNIEAASGRFFGAKELASADIEYLTNIPGFFAELNSRYKHGKLSLFCDLFNVKYNFDHKGDISKMPSAMKRLFGEQWGYLGQDGGDHWLYTRVAIAMAKRQKVKVPTANGYEEKSLWDALQIENYDGNEDIKRMFLPNGTLDVSTGKEFSIGDFSRKIGEVDKHLFGVYNKEDRVAAQRHIMGRLLLAYRQWIKPQLNVRFQGAVYNQVLGTTFEGHYRTVYRLLSDAWAGKINLLADRKKLKDWEIANLKAAFTDVVQFLIVLGLANLINWGEGKDRPWYKKFLEYIARREVHELGMFIPSPYMVREFSNQIKTPATVLGPIDNINSCLVSILSPEDWNNEIQTGPYKGMSTLEKKILKLPIPPLQWKHQLDRAGEDIDDAIDYYIKTQY